MRRIYYSRRRFHQAAGIRHHDRNQGYRQRSDQRGRSTAARLRNAKYLVARPEYRVAIEWVNRSPARSTRLNAKILFQSELAWLKKPILDDRRG